MSHIRIYTTIAADPDTVVQRFASLDGVRDWWTVDAEGDTSPGHEFTVGFGVEPKQRIRVDVCQPGRVEWQPLDPAPPGWAATRIIVTVEPHQAQFPWQVSGTALRLEHIDWPEFTDFAAQCNTIWSRLLLGFKRMCEQGGPSPERFDPARS